MKYSPSDCQRPEVLNKNLVEGNVLICGYSFNFVVGTASIKKVSETAKSLGAIGFVLAVENVSPGTKFDPVPVGIPGILITDVTKSMVSSFSFIISPHFLCHKFLIFVLPVLLFSFIFMVLDPPKSQSLLVVLNYDNNVSCQL